MADVAAADLRRVAVRDYGPWLGLILSWLIIVLAVGEADAARLFAAWAFVRSARYLTGLKVLPSLRKRMSPEGRFAPGAVCVAAAASGAGLLAGASVVALLIALLTAAGQEGVAQLCALLLMGLPPRYLLPLGARRQMVFAFRAASNWSGLALLAGAWLLFDSLAAVALAFALREWVGLAIALAAAPPIVPRRAAPDPLGWRELAARTADQSRHRLSYRLSKGALTLLLGPVGALSARVGRSAGLHRKLNRVTPQNPLPLFGLLLAAVGGAIALILLVPSPASLAIAASLAMVAAVAANVLLLGNVSEVETPDAGDEDDDEA